MKPGWHVRLHPDALSPDPTYGTPAPPGEGIEYFEDVFPWELVRCTPSQPAADAWGERLDGDRCPPELELSAASNGRVDLVFDFGTEVEATLELAVELKGRSTLTCVFGEFPMEVEHDFHSEHPRAERFVHFVGAGGHEWTSEQRGFRYVRLLFHDVHESLVIKRLKAHCAFVFGDRPGDFMCDDPRFQRAWQTSVYTARLCTRPDTIWDGIKRDRGGWFGDARIIKDAVDCVYHDPRPSRSMLASLPVDQWANGVPVYSFDAIAMLHNHILAFGLGEDCIAEAYDRVRRFLAWVFDCQTNDDGFITRDESQTFFGNVGFLDWSRMPVGGRFEELSWLQCKHVEGLRTAAVIGRWLGRADDAVLWEARASRLAKRIVDVFWRPGRGFVHTLNHVGEVVNPHVPGWGGHYQKTYVERIRLGESGPSRQCNALAVWAGIPDAQMRQTLLQEVFANPAIEPIITAYFLYYEQMARAACGDGAGAVAAMADYVADLLEDRNAATVIEMHDPRVRDFRKFCNHFEVTWTWPLSYCHGWGAGLVPLTQRHLMGLSPVAPGWSRLSLEGPAAIPLAFRATVPTPYGPVVVTRDERQETVHYGIPAGIDLTTVPPSGVVVERT
ncbi:MAG TPA: hypothetical protein VNA25_01760 [Phycisphaerae bacterium]|nr:hypothetical protein [Phycisphaerae bacterium]